jgi:hypothetical protein
MRNLNVGMMARLRRLRAFGERHCGAWSWSRHRIANATREAPDPRKRSCGQAQRDVRHKMFRVERKLCVRTRCASPAVE